MIKHFREVFTGFLIVVTVFTGHWSLVTSHCFADVPRMIHYQGRLTEPDGTPLAGSHTVTLRLYDAATGGVKLWEEPHELNLPRADNGIFAVTLGTQTPFPATITFNAPLWLTIEVDGAGEFSPRQILSAVSYAINADMIDGLDSTQLLAASGAGDITAVQAGAGLTGGATSGDATLDIGAGPGIVVAADALSVDVGTTAGKIVQLDGSGALPAVSGANLTGLGTAALADGSVTQAKLAGDSVGAAALASNAIQAGDIEVGDLPAHASAHQPGGADALPTASAVSIGSANGAGTSTSLARADHAHEGLHSIAVSGQGPVVGDALLAAGSNVTLSQDGQTITIAAAAAGTPGARATASASNAVTIDTSADTDLLSVTITKSQASSTVLILATVQLTHTATPTNKTVDLKLVRGAAAVDAPYTVRLGTANRAVSEIPVTVHAVDAPGAGSQTYTLRARSSDTGAQATIRRLTVIEVL